MSMSSGTPPEIEKSLEDLLAVLGKAHAVLDKIIDCLAEKYSMLCRQRNPSAYELFEVLYTHYGAPKTIFCTKCLPEDDVKKLLAECINEVEAKSEQLVSNLLERHLQEAKQ